MGMTMKACLSAVVTAWLLGILVAQTTDGDQFDIGESVSLNYDVFQESTKIPTDAQSGWDVQDISDVHEGNSILANTSTSDSASAPETVNLHNISVSTPLEILTNEDAPLSRKTLSPLKTITNEDTQLSRKTLSPLETFTRDDLPFSRKTLSPFETITNEDIQLSRKTISPLEAITREDLPFSRKTISPLEAVTNEDIQLSRKTLSHLEAVTREDLLLSRKTLSPLEAITREDLPLSRKTLSPLEAITREDLPLSRKTLSPLEAITREDLPLSRKTLSPLEAVTREDLLLSRNTLPPLDSITNEDLPSLRETLSPDNSTTVPSIILPQFATASVISLGANKSVESPTDEEGDYRGDKACIKLHITDKNPMKNEKLLTTIECIFLSYSIEDPEARHNEFLNCMNGQGIALNDPAVARNIRFADMQECFSVDRVPDNITNEELGARVSDRIICLTYVGSHHSERLLCTVPEGVKLDEDSEEQLIQYYRDNCKFKSTTKDISVPEVSPGYTRHVTVVKFGHECGLYTLPEGGSIRLGRNVHIIYVSVMVIAVLGLLGNIVAYGVLQSPDFYRVSPFTKFFIILVIADTMNLGLFIILLNILVSSSGSGMEGLAGQVPCSIMWYLYAATYSLLAWLTTLIAIVRSRAILNPLSAKRALNNRKVFKMILLLILASCASSGIALMSMDMLVGLGECHKGGKLVSETEFHFVKIVAAIYSVVGDLIPCVVMLIVNLFTVYSLLTPSLERGGELHRTTGKNKEWQASVFLLLSAFSFTLFSFPESILKLLDVFNLVGVDSYILYSNIAMVLRVFRSSSNFILYFISGSRFRDALAGKTSDILSILKNFSITK